MLIVVGGPMFAGKTTWLINYAKTLPFGSFRLFKPNIDTRYGKDEFVTHDGIQAAAMNISTDRPFFPNMDKSITTIILDELNFFSPDSLLPAVQEQLRLDKTVVGSGLMHDFAKNPFGATPVLSKMADKFVELFARCDGCGEKATHCYRKVKDQNQFLLGAAESYGACCLTCWDSFNTISSSPKSLL